VTKGANGCSPGANTKRSQIALTVVSIALSLGRLGTQLMGLPAQSLIETPAPVQPSPNKRDSKYSSKCESKSSIGPSGYREGMEAKQKRKKIKCFFGTQPKARAGWPQRLRLVQATPWAVFAVIGDQLRSTMTATFPYVALS